MTNDREAVIKAYQADLAKKGLYKGEPTGRRAAAPPLSAPRSMPVSTIVAP